MIRYFILICLFVSAINCGPEEEEGVKYADQCEGNFFDQLNIN